MYLVYPYPPPSIFPHCHAVPEIILKHFLWKEHGEEEQSWVYLINCSEVKEKYEKSYNFL